MTTGPQPADERAPDSLAASSPMTPDRWRVVDQILQEALGQHSGRRDAFVLEACANDDSLRREIASLLAAHDAAPSDFLERPAFEGLGLVAPLAAQSRPAAPTAPPVSPPIASSGSSPLAPPAAPPIAPVEPPPGRLVTARAALFVTVAAIVVGLMSGWTLSRSPIVERWKEWGGAAFRPAPRPVVAASRAQAQAFLGDAGGAGGDGSTNGLSLVVVDRTGRPVRSIVANRPWTPRFSPNGRLVAYGAFGEGRSTSDLWITDLSAGTTRRLTDDDADSNDPEWSPDGSVLAYSAHTPGAGGKRVVETPLSGGPSRVLGSGDWSEFPSDWPRDGGALVVTREGGPTRGGHDVLLQPADGSTARPYAATGAEQTAGRVSPNGRWIAYTSDGSGRAEVYLDSYPHPGQRVKISTNGGVHPVWRGDGKEIYYWQGDGLVAVRIDSGSGAPTVASSETLFRAPYEVGINAMYDASPDGNRFVIVEHR